MTSTDENALFITCVILIALLIITLGIHDSTYKSTDQSIANILYEYNVPLEKLEANKSAFEDYHSLKKEYLLLHYKENAQRAESRKVEK